MSNLNKLTITQIKEYAKKNNLKCPSGLKKDQLIEYLKGLLNDKKNQEEQPITFLTQKLQPRYPTPNENWLNDLHEKGYCIVQIPNWDPAFTDIFFEFLESCCEDFRSDDISTWKPSNLPILLHGILKHYFGHTEFQWKIRELCAPIFAEIFECDVNDLLCSFDGGCFLSSTNKNEYFKQWIHNDQQRIYRDFCCVQGIVNFVNNDFEDGGLVLVEGSHTIFNEYMNKHPSSGIVWEPADMSDKLLSERNLIKICAPAGHLILFDSRTFHCNVSPFENSKMKFRMCTYISMQPRNRATQKELEKRVKLYEKGRMSGHWTYGSWFKETAEHPRTYGNQNNKPQIIQIAELNDLRKRLIGY